MASFRVHEDQENRISELRQKPAAVHAVQQKRAVLGVIDNRNDRFNKKVRFLVHVENASL